MSNPANRTLGVREAARMIFATENPDAAQIVSVERRLRCGLLRGTCRGAGKVRWRTTSADVAEFLATQAYSRQTAGAAAGARLAACRCEAASAGQPAPCRRSASLAVVYREALRDYFAAMIFRRRMRRRSRRFRRAVLAGQAVLLGLLVSVAAAALWPGPAYACPEHAAIERWITETYGAHEVVRWRPPLPRPDGAGTLTRVEYRYASPGGKVIRSEQLFHVDAGRVQSADSD